MPNFCDQGSKLCPLQCKCAFLTTGSAGTSKRNANQTILRYHLAHVRMRESRLVVSNSLRPHGLYSLWNSPGQNAGVGNLSLLQEIFPTQGLNPRLPHCRQILYQVSHKRKSKNTGVGSLSLLQRLFLSQELNRGLWHCRWILYQVSYQGSPRVRKVNQKQDTKRL